MLQLKSYILINTNYQSSTMEIHIQTIITLILTFIISCHFIKQVAYKLRNLPPSPISLPIIGHLHLLHHPLHQTLTRIANQLGPIYLLHLGNSRVVHISSPSTVEECLIQNGVITADRPRFLTGDIFGYGSKTLIWSQYGNSWRTLRRIATAQILSHHRVQNWTPIMYGQVKTLIKRMIKESENGTVEIGSGLFEMTHDVMTRVLMKERYEGEESKRFKVVMGEVMRNEGGLTLVDIFPWLMILGVKEMVKRRFSELFKEKEVFWNVLMDKHRKSIESGSEKGEIRGLMEVLLLLQKDEPHLYTDDFIKGLCQVLLLGGTDTTAGTVEWALTLLLNNPTHLKKAQNEIDLQVGHHRLVNESDLINFPYLRCIIYETLRQYPPNAMLIPHLSSQKCIIGGYTIPRNTSILINIWAIQNDPNHWDEPETFRPERFEKFEEAKEQMRNKFMPFGLGRRACPGEAMAMRMVGLTLATLLQCFEWERPAEELIDMGVKAGLTTPKAEPLRAKCQTRDVVTKLISQL